MNARAHLHRERDCTLAAARRVNQRERYLGIVVAAVEISRQSGGGGIPIGRRVSRISVRGALTSIARVRCRIHAASTPASERCRGDRDRALQNSARG